ncbi:MAG: fumarylacetoacetate hydrolase family protein [Verrucomicrobiae bacterium]|nr:fumarylacetoacetate hydrolase family protein [Verrucomicrobiae bacterium]
MKIARFETGGKIHFGQLEGEVLHLLQGEPWKKVERTGEKIFLKQARLLAPVLPPDIIAIGANYRKHVEESGMKIPSAPLVFLKATSSLAGPGDAVVLPAMAPGEVDFEAELAIVIGRECRRVGEKEALGFVWGYTCANDISARDCQLKLDSQWARGKSFDTFCPLGPWIETELDPDAAGISLTLNGQTLQSSNTGDMIFNCARLVSYCSQICTLRPGTVILTGTPQGVGFARKPPVFLKPGDTMEVVVEGIGALCNSAKAER